MFSKILLATDGSSHSLRAAEHAAYLAQKCGASISLISVAHAPIMYRETLGSELLEAITEDAKKILENTAAVLKQKGISISADKRIVKEGYPPDVICNELRDGNYDLLIVGGGGLRTEKERILGCTADKVVHFSHCSILVVK